MTVSSGVDLTLVFVDPDTLYPHRQQVPRLGGIRISSVSPSVPWCHQVMELLRRPSGSWTEATGVLVNQAILREHSRNVGHPITPIVGAFYNTSQYDFDRLLADAPQLAGNLRNFIAGFSDNMRDVLDKFDFDNTISKLDEAGLLFQVMERFKTVDLHPDRIDNATMGMIFEELIRRFNEALDENPGEHFTPRDVVHLMVDLMLAGDEQRIAGRGVVRSVYDPCCGSGGMLMIAKEHITSGRHDDGHLLRPAINPQAEIHLFGQEVNPETWAVSKSDMFMKDPTGRDADNLFLLHMLAHAQPRDQGGARIAIIMNGSPLFTGDAGSGESEIRRYILEHDLLEALIALPEQLFYNTGIATYVWLLTTRKAPARKGRVQLIDATTFWSPMRRSLGDKRRQIPPDQAADVLDLLDEYKDGATRSATKDGAEEEVTVSRIYPTTHFGYRKITVERPPRLNFQASAERIARLDDQRGFQNLAKSKKRGDAGAKEEAAGRALQQAIVTMLKMLPDTLLRDRDEFLATLAAATKRAHLKLAAPVRKAILTALAERDETAAICRDQAGAPEPDPELRDTERVPLGAGHDPADAAGVPASVHAFFDREVRPHVPDAWIDTSKRDPKDGHVGIVGYEINFNRYFYQYKPPRPLAEIQADIRAIESDIVRLLAEITHGEGR